VVRSKDDYFHCCSKLKGIWKDHGEKEGKR
jgi:hypothetical protein